MGEHPDAGLDLTLGRGQTLLGWECPLGSIGTRAIDEHAVEGPARRAAWAGRPLCRRTDSLSPRPEAAPVFKAEAAV